MTATSAKSIARLESDLRATDTGWEVVTCTNGKVSILSCLDEPTATKHLHRYRRERVRELINSRKHRRAA